MSVNIEMNVMGTDNQYQIVYPQTTTDNVIGLNTELSNLESQFNQALINYFTKDQTLQDSTATMFGLNVNAIPDDVFAYLGKYAQHWWRRRKASQVALGEAVTLPSANTYSKNELELVCFSSSRSGSNTSFNTTPVYSQCTTVDGRLVLSDESSVGNYSYNTYLGGNLDPAKGKYFKSVAGKIYKVDADATPQRGIDTEYSDFWVWMSPLYPVFIQENPWEYVQSSNRSTYPDSGEQGGYEYQYLGIPFENAAGSLVQIEIGSYVGTGTRGSSKPNTLAIPSWAKAVIILPDAPKAGWYSTHLGIFLYGMTYPANNYGGLTGSSSESSSNIVVLSGWGTSQLSWYGATAQGQLNDLNYTYHYIILG